MTCLKQLHSFRILQSAFCLALAALCATSAQAGTFIRFTISKVRTNATGIQMSELAVYDTQGERVNLNLTKAASGTTAPNLAVGQFIVSHEGSPASQYAVYLFDGKTTTKYYHATNPSDASPRVFTMRLADAVEIGGYNFCSANDVNFRDPVSWTVETSDNGSDWEEVDSIADFVPTTTRTTWYDGLGGTSGDGSAATYFVLAISPFKIAPIPDQLLFMDPVTPEPVVTDRETGDTLVKDVHYTVSYTDNDKGGFGVVTVTGKDGSAYVGESATALFNVYRRVKSITSTGTQYINTGIVPGLTTAVEMHFCTTNKTGSNTSFFGAGRYNQVSSYCLFQNGMYYFIGSKGTSLRYPYEDGVDNVISINTNAADNCFLNVGGNIATSTISLAYTGSNNLHIFASSGGDQKSKFTLYSFKMWKDGELVRDFVPVRGATSGLYDLQNDKFYKNAGTGDFIPGPDLADIAVA